jgi:hypothetical protein
VRFARYTTTTPSEDSVTNLTTVIDRPGIRAVVQEKDSSAPTRQSYAVAVTANAGTLQHVTTIALAVQ